MKNYFNGLQNITVCFVFLLLTGQVLPITAETTIVKKVLSADEHSGENLAVPERVGAYDKGFTKDGNEFVCDNGDDVKTGRGIVFAVNLNQTEPAPIRAEGRSRAENVNGSPSSDYGLYIDITYTDNTHLWGITNPFSAGTHDWERKTLFIMPEKPVKTVYFYGLFRNRSGKVLFKDFKLSVTKSDASAAVFDGIPVQTAGVTDSLRPLDKISVQLRDAAANSDFLSVRSGTGSALGIKTDVKFGNTVEITLENTDGTDRCLTLVVARNCKDLTDKSFCRIRENVPVKGEMMVPSQQYQVGSNGRQAKFPFAAIIGNDADKKCQGYALGIDLSYPAFFRLGYNDYTSELFAAVDVALTKESPKAVLKFVEYNFNGKDGFRGAVAQYYELFPDFFRCRTPEQGVWMPFAAISKVPQFEDFGFKFKEGNDEPAFDDEHNILTFRYTEPMTWWMPMPKESPRTYEAAMDIVNKEAAKGNAYAEALLKCGMKTADGKVSHIFLDTPWCTGVVWSYCDLPNIAGGGYAVKWNKKLADDLYGVSPNRLRSGIDGEYIDSSEGYVTAVLDYDRSHFSAARCPLVFDGDNFKPAIFRGLVAYEYTRSMSEDIHRRGKLMMANSTPHALCWLAPYLDVMGTETNWNYDNRWSPMGDDELMFRRVLCGPKPYCFLMNTDFTKWSYECTEKFIKRSLAYGMFPGFFSADASTGHYFKNPDLYERDRPLFKKYIPLCKLVAEANWQPLTFAVSNVDNVYVERFGNELPKSIFTVFNDTGKTQNVEIRFNTGELPKKLVNHLDGKEHEMKDNTVKLTLGAEDVAVLSSP
ncbi:MAG: hypothetical protein LBN39_12920 [Planctomycetaceae bacterium]|jgi:hypothetical protein|nr:hypothetical protein [Planctomycetaceae bacterium]